MSPKRVDIEAEALRAIVDRAGKGALSEEDRALLSAAVDTLTVLTQELEESDVTIGCLRRLLFGPQSEKTRDVVGAATDSQQTAATEDTAVAADAAPSESTVEDNAPKDDTPAAEKEKRKGHGRRGADTYTGAERRSCPHGVLGHGDRCPECSRVPPCAVGLVGEAPGRAGPVMEGAKKCGADLRRGVGIVESESEHGAGHDHLQRRSSEFNGELLLVHARLQRPCRESVLSGC